MKFLKLFLILTLFSSCKSNMDKCIEEYVDEKDYTYEEACEICEEMRQDAQN